MRELDHVHLPVRDLAASVAFYRDRLGLELGFESQTMAEFTDVGVVLDQAAGIEIGGGVIVGLRVDDVDHVYGTLKARGVKAQAPPRDRSWGVRNFYVDDPDGHQIEFEQPLE